jgi:hypothetical protein
MLSYPNGVGYSLDMGGNLDGGGTALRSSSLATSMVSPSFGGIYPSVGISLRHVHTFHGKMHRFLNSELTARSKWQVS